jgi:hypothetical protein
VTERAGPGDRVILRQDLAGGVGIWTISGFRGTPWPEVLTDPQFSPLDAADSSWRLTAAEGVFDFFARGVAFHEERPVLFETLHRPFALKATDRLALRALLWLLRLPGGARLLHRWHAQRN